MTTGTPPPPRPTGRGPRPWRWLPALGALAVVGVLVAVTPGRPEVARGDEPDTLTPPLVRTAPVSTEPVTRSDLLYGVTAAPDRGRLAFTVGGRLTEREIEVGDRVATGTVLARVDHRPFRHGLSAAEASVVQLEARETQLVRDRDRIDALLGSGASTEQQAEQIGAELRALRAGLSAARAQAAESRRLLGEAVLRAPYDATVTAVFLEVGEHASPGRPVVELSGRSGLEVEVEAPEAVASRVSPGDEVSVELPGRRLVVDGVVRSVSESGRGPGALFPVRVELADPPPAAAPGLTARLVLREEGRAALVVPLRAVMDPTGRHPSVFRVASGRVERVPVEVDGLSEGRVVIAQGLEAGERVVVEGHGRILDGDEVRMTGGEE